MSRKKKQPAVDVADEQRRNTRQRLRRKALILLIGSLALTAVVVGTTWFEPDTVFKQTVSIGDASYVCRIKKSQGMLQAEWSRTTFLWHTGEADTAPIGVASAIGTNNPQITADQTTGRITFEIGGAKTIVRPGR